MDFIKYTTEWVKGEVFQGKIMIGIGILLLVGAIAIFKSEHEVLRGTLIPLGLIIIALLGYGGFQIAGRPAHIDKVNTIYQQNPKEAIEQEYNKAMKDNKAYSTLKPVWAGLIILSVILYFIFSSYYFKGLAIGGVALFLSLLILDTTLHYRLQGYFKHIVEAKK
ncbi:MAG: hypothetical protein GY827_06840 [Cytophagales bacterium]|nr:hypothetical protein [Cytophagales bacterium]